MVVVALYHCSVCYTGITSKKIAGLKILELQCLQIVLRLVVRHRTCQQQLSLGVLDIVVKACRGRACSVYISFWNFAFSFVLSGAPPVSLACSNGQETKHTLDLSLE